jgi:hypothetical protein
MNRCIIKTYCLLLSVILLFSSVIAQSQHADEIYYINPVLYNDGFTYFHFPFNSSYCKKRKIKKITFFSASNKGKTAPSFFEFDRDGRLMADVSLYANQEKGTMDTIQAYFYSYVAGTNRVHKKIEKNATAVADGRVYYKFTFYCYDVKGRLVREESFSLQEWMPPVEKLQPDTEPQPPGTGMVSFDKRTINGEPIDKGIFEKLLTDNDFTSWRYSYAVKDSLDITEAMEVYDFSKKYGQTDTCKIVKIYHCWHQIPVMLLSQYECKGSAVPDEYYHYNADTLLTEIKAATDYKPRDTKFTYDSRKRMVLLENIWSGSKVSEMRMLYDDKGFLKKMIRQSARNANYFMDTELVLEYEFFE